MISDRFEILCNSLTMATVADDSNSAVNESLFAKFQVKYKTLKPFFIISLDFSAILLKHLMIFLILSTKILMDLNTLPKN